MEAREAVGGGGNTGGSRVVHRKPGTEQDVNKPHRERTGLRHSPVGDWGYMCRCRRIQSTNAGKDFHEKGILFFSKISSNK